MSTNLLHVDSRSRVTFPKQARVHTGDDLEMEVLEDGRILLTPIVRVPRHQMWACGPEADRLLAEAARDESPLVSLATPGALEAMRKRLGVK